MRSISKLAIPEFESHFKRISSCILLALGILVVFLPVMHFDFLSLDDSVYVYDNPHVQGGLGKEGVLWAFSALEAGFWHPLTWMSLMLDYTWYGLNAGGYHWTNVLLHLACTLLLFLVLNGMTGAVFRSGLVAALFALHPLHVESVAWVAQRKDVLSGLFWMLAMGSYVWYARRPGWDRYLLVLVFLILGLMAKPMLVTLPFVFLLLDYWPLKRLQDRRSAGVLETLPTPTSSTVRLIVEKAPLVAIAAVFSVIALMAEDRAGALPSLARFSMEARFSNAVVSYGVYLWKTIWPFDLAVFYPHPGAWPLSWVLGSGIFLLAASVFVVYEREQFPYLAVGWFWYLGVLLPVSGLIQVGSHGMADRYTYLPLIGIFLIIVWGIADLAAGLKIRASVVVAAACVLMVLLMGVARQQVMVWKDSKTLYEHALEATKKNYFVHGSLGTYFLGKGLDDTAIRHFLRAIAIKPNYEPAYYGMAVILEHRGDYEKAVHYYQQAIAISPDATASQYRLADLLVRMGKLPEAYNLYQSILKHGTGDPVIFNEMGLCLARMNRNREAEIALQEAVRMNPHHAGYRNNLALVLDRQCKIQAAVQQLQEAVRIEPYYAAAHYHLAEIFLRERNYTEARKHYQIAVNINLGFQNEQFLKKMNAR
jgi:tetratricopeptide (TPR) repeat protein